EIAVPAINRGDGMVALGERAGREGSNPGSVQRGDADRGAAVLKSNRAGGGAADAVDRARQGNRTTRQNGIGRRGDGHAVRLGRGEGDAAELRVGRGRVQNGERGVGGKRRGGGARVR